MTIDINLLRADKGGDPEKVRESEKRRFRDGKIVDKVIELDKKYIKAQFDTEQKRKESNAVQKEITERKKTSKGKDECKDLLPKKEALEAEALKLEEASEAQKKEVDKALKTIGNILHDSVPVSQDEEKDNKVVALFGTPRDFGGIKFQTTGFRPHFELLEMIDGVEFAAGHAIAGNRAYYLKGPAVLLNQALLNYGLAFLSQRGYTAVQPPYFMNKDIMAKTAELDDYDDVLYKVVEDPERPELDKYMIATSEQPVSALHMNSHLDKKTIPKRYVGISSCFRREAGSSGRDIRGIFRVHQFEKIEQFNIVEPEDSWEEHDRMIKQAEEFYQSLDIPYHVVAIVSGEINNAAAKKYDLEAWFPGDNEGKGQYRELVSCSNCTDYQSRALNVKSGFANEKDVCYAHMLNSTLCATERAMCCLLENYQTAEGIRVPRALVPFMCGQEFIPFVKDPPKDESKKQAAAPKKK